MHRSMRSIPLAIALTLSCAAVFAQEAANFTALTACRIDSERVLLRATFDGGACQAVEPAQLAEPRGTIVSVHLPTVNTAQMCTMQIVPVQTEQVIEAGELIANLDVTVGDPENNQIVHGEVEVEEGNGDCLVSLG